MKIWKRLITDWEQKLAVTVGSIGFVTLIFLIVNYKP